MINMAAGDRHRKTGIQLDRDGWDRGRAVSQEVSWSICDNTISIKKV